MRGFLQALETQRWDDHRYYHRSRINQALHLVSAIGFLCAYLLFFVQPAAAALVGWLVAMASRQAGHFFFEPRGYDAVNGATHAYKESIKVGYNLRRKVILHLVWALSPLVLVVDPTCFGLLEPHTGLPGFLHNVGLLWLAVGVGALLGRTVLLVLTRDPQTGLVWMTKILTDPFNDVRLYHRSVFALLRGELIDPAHGKPRA